jgi:hypothetical protein
MVARFAELLGVPPASAGAPAGDGQTEG